MALTISGQRTRSKGNYYFWVGVFFLMIFGVVMTIYYAAARIDYVWQWYKLPKAFINHATVEINSNVEGIVESIQTENKKAKILIKSDDATETYEVPVEDIRVYENDFIYIGDTLATYREWQAGILLQGLWMTLKVSLISIFLGIFIGLVGGIARISDNPALKWSAITYVELIRGSPLLVQIFIWYFVLGTMFNQILLTFGFKEISEFWYGAAALATFTGAYVTEIVRAGIQSIHRGQTEAARSLGMTYAQSMRYVILPQAMRRILPPLAGQFISLIKDSSLLGIIAVRELLKATREVVTVSLSPFELFFTCAVLYLVMTFALSMFVQYLERRTATQ